MRRLLVLSALAFFAAMGGIFLSSSPALNSTKTVPGAAADSGNSGIAGANADARGPASGSAIVPVPAAPPSVSMPEQLRALRETKVCLESEKCDFPQTDPRSYSFAVGRRIAEQLSQLGAAYSIDPSLELEVAEAAREFMQMQDGFVQEQAMLLMGQLPPSSSNLDAMIAGLEHSPDPLLVEQAMKEWERYLGSAEEERIQNFLADFIAHGGQFSSEKASELILNFLNERSLPTFEEKLASMVPESTPARHLRAALNQYRLQRQGG